MVVHIGAREPDQGTARVGQELDLLDRAPIEMGMPGDKDIITILRGLGLTQYEAQVYRTLLRKRHDTARSLAKDSGVPRTKIYSVLEDLADKGWVKALSGWPLIFTPKDPRDVIDRKSSEYLNFLETARQTLDREARDMIEKFVVARQNIGFEDMIDAVSKANTVWLSNVSREMYDKLADHFKDGAEVKVIFFPGEIPPKDGSALFKEGVVRIVHMVENQEVPAMNIVVEEERSFTAYKDPFSKKWHISEMLYDDCVSCFRDWYQLGWESSKELGATKGGE